MKRPENNNWIDTALTEALAAEKSEPDFEGWKNTHPEAVETLTSQAGQTSHVRRRNLWQMVIESKITKAAAAAVIVVCAWLYFVMTPDRPDIKQPGTPGTKPKIRKITKSIHSPNDGVGHPKSKLTEDKSGTGKTVAMMGPVLFPPGPGEVRLDTNLDGEKRNEEIPGHGWICICGSSHLFWHYTGPDGVRLNFKQEDMRVYVTVDDGPRQLAGLRFSKPNDIEHMRASMEELTEPTILWCECAPPNEFSALPNLDMVTDLCWGRTSIAAAEKGRAVSSREGSPPQWVGGFELSDLSGLAGFTGLTSLNLAGFDQLTDLSPLASLTNLTSLDLQGCNKITDLSPLANLTNLESLNLNAWDVDTELSDISPLAELIGLKSLSLRLRSVRDLTPLAGLTELEYLDLMGCRPSDLAPLAKLAKLKFLKLDSVKSVADVSPLGELTSLEYLRIGAVNKSVTDTCSISNLVNLKHLNLDQWHSVTDISSLANLTNLTLLRLNALRRLSDISPLAQLENLESLDLSDCKEVSDISALANLTKLKSLDLTDCRGVYDLSPLANLTGLRHIALRLCPNVYDLSPLRTAISQGAKVDLRTATTTNESLERQLSEMRAQILAERIAESSVIVEARILEITDTLDGDEVIGTELEVEVREVFYGRPFAPSEVIDVVLPEPDAEWSTDSVDPGGFVVLFLAERGQRRPYSLVYGYRGFLPPFKEEIKKAVESLDNPSNSSSD